MSECFVNTSPKFVSKYRITRKEALGDFNYVTEGLNTLKSAVESSLLQISLTDVQSDLLRKFQYEIGNIQLASIGAMLSRLPSTLSVETSEYVVMVSVLIISVSAVFTFANKGNPGKLFDSFGPYGPKREYNSMIAKSYFSRRPLAVASRSLSLLTTASIFGLGLLSDLLLSRLKGKIDMFY